jgi:hypothetical protein
MEKRNVSMRRLQVVAVMLGSLGLLGCAGTNEPPPTRPAVAVADEVGAVDRARLVGTWQCRELNPYPGAPRLVTTVTYASDGSFTSQGTTAAGEAGPSPMRFSGTGHWRVEGDRLITSDVHSDVTAADGNPLMSALGAISSSIANNFMRDRSGPIDVLRLTANELVLRPIGIEDPPVQSCTR